MHHEHRPDAIIEVRFKTPDEGGRKSAVNGDFYACPMLIDGAGYDCRIFLDKAVELGELFRLSVKFLNRDLVVPKLSRGKNFKLWEGKEVATGHVLEVRAKSLV